MTTTKQADFILSLVEARYRTLGCDTLDEAVAKVLAQADLLDTKAASIFIDRIKSLPPDPDSDMPAKVATSVKNGRNGRSQPCVDCNTIVNAGEGYYYLNAGGKFDVVHKIGQCHRLTAEEAAEYGRLHRRCIVCRRALTDAPSLEAGYGKTCADNNGWPWGAK